MTVLIVRVVPGGKGVGGGAIITHEGGGGWTNSGEQKSQPPQPGGRGGWVGVKPHPIGLITEVHTLWGRMLDVGASESVTQHYLSPFPPPLP
jgi:hypothetical protein